MLARSAILVAAMSLSGCASPIPDLSNEYDLPIQAILTHAVCELNTAFHDLKTVKGFKADQWAISISLTPKIDTEFTANLGASGKSTTNAKALNYITWTLGTTGLQFDFKGHRDGSVSFLVHSSQLLDNKHPVSCPPADTPNALMQKLGIEEWLARLITTDENGISQLTSLDKPSYNSEIIVKFDAGTGGLTFVGPYASIAPSVFGSHTRDETLSIAMTPEPLKQHVQTLPVGSIQKGYAGPSPSLISNDARDRLDTIQTDSILRNLRVQPE